ncbi:Nucleoside-diphosphate sugar epimerase [Balamuthia mandrillaris]
MIGGGGGRARQYKWAAATIGLSVLAAAFFWGSEEAKDLKVECRTGTTMSAPQRRAIVLGATGAVGKSLVTQLLRSSTFSTVTTLGRRSVPLETYLDSNSTEEEDGKDTDAISQKLHQQVLEDLSQLSEHQELFSGHDTVFCCLGTTIKTAGSQEQFRKVDHDYVMAAATIGRAQGVRQFSLVSSVGANPNAWAFYSRVKGEVEQDLKSLGFPTLSIFRPSLLMTARPEHAPRPGEAIAQRVWPWISWSLVGPLRKYREIPVETVAQAMLVDAEQGWCVAKQNRGGEDSDAGEVRLYESDEIHVLAAAGQQ